MPVNYNDVVRQEEGPLAAPVDQTLACLQRQLVLEFFSPLLSYRHLGKCRLHESWLRWGGGGGKEPMSSKVREFAQFVINIWLRTTNHKNSQLKGKNK